MALRRLVTDIEANGYTPSIIFCVGIFDLDTRGYHEFFGESVVDGLLMLNEADQVIGHYIKGYDLPVIKRLTEGLVDIGNDRAIDTLEMSRRLFPQLPRHGISYWGEILGYPKMEWKDFSKFDPGMLPYMARDIEINVMMYEFLLEYEQKIQMLLENTTAQ